MRASRRYSETMGVNLRTAVAWLPGLTAALGLALMAYIGFYNRYWSDDWCYLRDFRQLGIPGTLNGYFFTGEEATRGYSTNRFSVTLLTALFYLPGVPGTQVLAAITIALWLGGLFWVLTALSRSDAPVQRGLRFSASAVLLYYVLYFSTHRFQILYWQAGVHYSYCIIAGIYIAGLLLKQVLEPQPDRFTRFAIAPLAFLAGGLSEIGGAYLFSGVSIYLVAIFVAKRRQSEWAARALPAAVTAWVFLLLALIALAVSPSNGSRYANLGTGQAPLLSVPFLALKFSLQFIVDSFRRLPLPHLVLSMLFAGLGILARSFTSGSPSGSLRRAGLTIGAAALTAVLLIAAVHAPTAYFYQTPPDPRHQSLARFTMLGGLALAAWMAGQAASGRLKPALTLPAALLLVLTGVIYTARLIVINHGELPGYVDRALAWDARDVEIRSAVEQGHEFVDVRMIDTRDIDTRDLMRSRDMRGGWISNCASEFYGAEAFRAVAP